MSVFIPEPRPSDEYVVHVDGWVAPDRVPSELDALVLLFRNAGADVLDRANSTGRMLVRMSDAVRKAVITALQDAKKRVAIMPVDIDHCLDSQQ